MAADGTDDPYAQYRKSPSYLKRLDESLGLNKPKPRAIPGLRDAMSEDGRRGRPSRTQSSNNWPVRAR